MHCLPELLCRNVKVFTLIHSVSRDVSSWHEVMWQLGRIHKDLLLSLRSSLRLVSPLPWRREALLLTRLGWNFLFQVFRILLVLLWRKAFVLMLAFQVDRVFERLWHLVRDHRIPSIVLLVGSVLLDLSVSLVRS